MIWTRLLAEAATVRPGRHHAARFLGSYESVRLADQLAAALRQDTRLGAGVRIMLERLLSLLTREHVQDPHRPEMAYFVAIDPSDPVIEEICLLTGGLRSAIDQANALGREVAAVNRPGLPEAISVEPRCHGWHLQDGVVAFLGFGWRDVPIGPSSWRLLNQSTQVSVARSTASKLRHGPRRWMSPAL